MVGRIKWIDIAKGIAIISVVIGHTIIKKNSMLLWSFIYSFHMPLFFLVSGYLFKEKSVKQFIKDSGKRLLVPYIVTVMLFIAYKIYITGNILKTLEIQVKTYLYASGEGTKFLRDINPTGAVWFLIALFVAGLIFNVVLKIKDNRIQFLTVIVLVVTGYSLRTIKYLPWSLDVALVSQILLYIGYTAKQRRFNISNLPIIAIPLLIFLWIICIQHKAFDMNSRNYNDLAIMLTGSISGCAVIFYLSTFIEKIPLLEKFLTYCGKESLVILCIHFLDTRKIIPWAELLHYKSSSIPTSTLITLIVLKLWLYLFITLLLKKILLMRFVFYPKVHSPVK